MPKVTSQTELPIHQWIQGLAEMDGTAFTNENVQGYFLRHAILRSSLEPYTFFSSKNYTRNLIFKNDLFECLALCWDIGQSSPIHSHNDGLGWMRVVDGRLFVQNYRIIDEEAVRHNGPLIPIDAVELSSEQTSSFDKEQAIHQVSNLSRFNQRAISVHLYRDSQSDCEVYSLNKGTCEVARYSYTSEFGRLSPGINL